MHREHDHVGAGWQGVDDPAERTVRGDVDALQRTVEVAPEPVVHRGRRTTRRVGELVPGEVDGREAADEQIGPDLADRRLDELGEPVGRVLERRGQRSGGGARRARRTPPPPARRCRTCAPDRLWRRAGADQGRSTTRLVNCHPFRHTPSIDDGGWDSYASTTSERAPTRVVIDSHIDGGVGNVSAVRIL